MDVLLLFLTCQCLIFLYFLSLFLSLLKVFEKKGI